jgi:hypothetical protein
MAGEDAFEIAAAVAAISGLAALLVMSLIAVVSTWRLFRHTSDTAVATARSVAAVEEAARRLQAPQPAPAAGAGSAAGAELTQQIAHLLEQHRQLQEALRRFLESASLPSAPIPELDDLEVTVNRLETTVGQMAASLANLIQILERERRS